MDDFEMVLVLAAFVIPKQGPKVASVGLAFSGEEEFSLFERATVYCNTRKFGGLTFLSIVPSEFLKDPVPVRKGLSRDALDAWITENPEENTDVFWDEDFEPPSQDFEIPEEWL